MSIKDLLAANRSYRRFRQEETLDEKTLVDLVAVTGLCASAANRQPLKYMISWEPELNAAVFSHLAWAAALTDWPGPDEGQRPAGYIVVLGDTRVAENFHCDHGIAAQSILLAAAEQGLGGCMLASVNRKGLRQTLSIPDHLEILLVLALGRPAETVVLEPNTPPEQRPYWRDDQDVHHVPKRALEEILIRSSES